MTLFAEYAFRIAAAGLHVGLKLVPFTPTALIKFSNCHPEGLKPKLHQAGGIACSRWDTRQPNRVLANTIAGNDAERWPDAGKVRLAAAKHEGAEVRRYSSMRPRSVRLAARVGPATSISPSTSFFISRKRVDVLPDECGVRADRRQRT